MCGICGTVALTGGPLRQPDAVERLTAGLRHRGPDGEGIWRSARAAIGATRLRIVDLDPRADQPFADPDDVVLVCNGEIYNAGELRRRYVAYPYHSRSDVEVLLPLYLDGGPGALDQLDGMFAVAVWDARRSLLTLARDRAGEKPLFYLEREGEIWFASEIGALLGVPGVPRTLDPEAAAEFVQLGYVRGPRTLLSGIRQVPAGTILTFAGDRRVAHRYWRPVEPPGPRPDAAAIRTLLEHAVEQQVAADVPIGVFVSGGLDSAILAALAVRTLGAERVRTFVVGFRERAYDERRFAAGLARHLATRHLELEVPEHDVPAALDALAATGEPIGDPAAVPTWFLARAARESVTVVLSGEGGDELFGGYPTYIGHVAAPAFARAPAALRHGAARALELVPPSSGRMPLRFLLERFVAAADRPWTERHLAWFGTGLPPDILRREWRTPAPRFDPPDPHDPDVLRQVRWLDYETELRERLLVKVDRATMRVALEARAPFLDRDVTRAALSAPGATHIRGIRTKCLLREVARPWVPEFIVRRTKRGLTVPVGSWLNGVLASAADEHLRRDRLDGQRLLDGAAVARLMAEHREGRANHGRALWPLLTLQHWMAYWRVEVG